MTSISSPSTCCTSTAMIYAMALEERREILASMIEPGGRIQFSEPLPGEAKAIFHLIDQAGLAGMVSNRRDSNTAAASRPTG